MKKAMFGLSERAGFFAYLRHLRIKYFADTHRMGSTS
jgi:hypothetical protein